MATQIRVYDVPEVIDRYTVVIDRGDVVEFYAMSENPFHPQGVNVFCGESQEGYEEFNLGQLLNMIPQGILPAIMERL